MTVTDHHPPPAAEPQISPELFEEIAHLAAREDVHLEYLNGKMETRPVPDGDHDEILMWMMQEFMGHRPDLRLNITGRGLKVDTYRNGRARPDGVLAPREHFRGSPEWAEPDGVLAVVEVTSGDADTHTRDRVEKPAAYAATGIGVYLLVDRDANAVVVHSRPAVGRYLDRSEHPYGEAVEVPGVGIVLDTDTLKRFAR
ncbi:Uma2 family endonuclease [Nocardiopsis sp. Huas11]|uniref:Uma2 family endonuclease n=1 Tax=Nocardiopsis sp. Huas11 TaxID=2183912 RepID=UPI000EAB8042|nr:Uma2 family endonuclease [Nocardiopsis sp. Huas11]RKS09002.1 Uma2 family endonuclease [Nocardiopsis sp. Huas11]